MLKIEVRPVQNQTELDDMYYQRWLVLRAPLGMDRGTEKDKYEDSAFHLVAVCDDKIIGSARLRELPEAIGSIAYVAVLTEFRNQGIGRKLIDKLIENAKQKNLKSLRLRSRISALEFYKKLGFSEQGEPYDYLGIPHILMNLSLQSSLNQSRE